MDKYIQIKNCNCVSDATIKIVENALNIKYGSNGTGKSTISEAIFAHTSDKLDRLASLKPYGSDADCQPTVNNPYFQTVRVFDENYVNSYLFLERNRETNVLDTSMCILKFSKNCVYPFALVISATLIPIW